MLLPTAKAARTAQKTPQLKSSMVVDSSTFESLLRFENAIRSVALQTWQSIRDAFYGRDSISQGLFRQRLGLGLLMRVGSHSPRRGVTEASRKSALASKSRSQSQLPPIELDFEEAIFQ